jgi:thiol-disulfide isomerase/thioredoxin
MLADRFGSTRHWIFIVLATVLTAGGWVIAQVATTEPSAAMGGDATTQPAARTPDVVMGDLRADSQQLSQIIGDPKALGDEATRKAVAPKAIPVLKKMMGEFDEMAAIQPEEKEQIQRSQDQFLAFLSILGDADATAKLNEMVASADANVAIRGQSGQLLAQWIVAGKDATAQGKIADDLEKLDKTHTDSIPLTTLTAMFSESAVSPELKTRLQGLVTDTMNNDVATELKQNIVADQKLKSIENKPLVITGAQVDGKAFTTADWKGKVVLVDFWATWCGPCVAELPRVKKIYADYHDKGLEILGVSNDMDVQALKDFVVKDEMPWPQLFDAAAASQQQWNPITTGFGINGIPTMFLIDKNGVLRTVEARENMEELIPKLLAE